MLVRVCLDYITLSMDHNLFTRPKFFSLIVVIFLFYFYSERFKRDDNHTT